MAYSTGNPVEPNGSSDPRDLRDNAQIIDKLVNASELTWLGRLGKVLKSWAGMTAEHEAAQMQRSFEFQQFLESSGYEVPVAYAPGLSITRSTQTVLYDGQLYRPKVADLPFVTTTFSADADKWVVNGDNSLRQELGADTGGTVVGFEQTLPGAIARNLDSAMRDAVVSERDFASVQDALTGLGKQKRALRLGGRTVTLDAIPANQYGTRIEDGKLLVPSLIPGQVTQLNTYADDVNGLFIGRENLAWFWKGVTLNTPFNVYFYGDSTVELGPGWPKKAHELFQMALQDAGVNNSKVYNRGVSGTSWSDLNALPDISPITYLFIIKYGINDAAKANPLETFAADARAKLTAIRATPYGGIRNLGILLMGPNSTYSPSFNQDAKWYEDLRNVFLQLCKEFDCAYFDTYAYLQQTKYAPGFWMDDLVSLGHPGEGLHPDQFAVWWLYRAGLKDFVLGDGGWNVNKANTDWNLTNYTKPALAEDLSTAYPYGRTQQLAFSSNGFPIEGQLVTQRQADDATVQYIYTQDVVPRTASRRGNPSGWTQWAGVLAAVTGFLNSWANKGGGYAEAGYQIGDDGFVELFGVVTGGGTSSVIFMLPVGARPAAAHVYPASGGGMVLIFTNGEVSSSGVTPTTLGLDGIRFKAL